MVGLSLARDLGLLSFLVVFMLAVAKRNNYITQLV